MAALTLLLLRHGIAEERRAGLEERERGLTERGRSRTRAMLDQLVARGGGAERLLSSPLRRALQTAAIAEAAGWAPAPEVEEALAPGGDALAALPGWLREPEPLAGARRLALVGHEPDLSALAARLIGAPPGALALRKAGLIELELPDGVARPGQGRLTALLRPGLLLA